MIRKNILRYASTSANLYNFLGDRNFANHINIYKACINNALQAHADIKSFAVDKAVIVDPANVLPDLLKRPMMLVTFHTGSYNLPASSLLKAGYKVNVLSDTESVQNHDYNQVSHLYQNKYKNDCSMEMVNVEADGAIFNILRQFKSGVQTIAYLDGNKGIGGQTKYNENMLDVSFLNGIIRVRKGLAFIAYLVKAPVVVVLSHRENGTNYVTYHPPIVIEERDRDVFCSTALREIFKIFEAHVKNHFDQWSNWLYVHNWTDLDHFKTKIVERRHATLAEVNEFNHDRFCPLRLDGKFYLFDRILYSASEVEEAIVPAFSFKSTREERVRFIEELKINRPDLTENLAKRNVLVPA
jgi:lauroyl/myristoyl acyltransferase